MGDNPEGFKKILAGNILDIGSSVRKKRFELKYSQQELAYLANCERATISNIERGMCETISLKTLVKIAIVLGCEIKDLIK